MFKLLRLWNLAVNDRPFTPREIPPERRDFGAGFPDNERLVAQFNKSERYKLIESYGLNSFTETNDGLCLEIGFTNREYIVSWLLGFRGNVRVIEPSCIIDDLKTAAKKIIECHK